MWVTAEHGQEWVVYHHWALRQAGSGNRFYVKAFGIVLLALDVVALTSITATAKDFSGPVVSIIDNDTIEVLQNQHPERIRLPQSRPHPKERRPLFNRKN
jgi:endonuclease YncB( thermonuclease family)